MKKILLMVSLIAVSLPLVATEVCPSDCNSCSDMRLECQEAREQGCECNKDAAKSIIGEQGNLSEEEECRRARSEFSRTNPKEGLNEQSEANTGIIETNAN